MSSPEARLKPDHEIQLSDSAGVVQPVGSESKQGPNTTNPSQAESLLAAEKRTLEMMANGASLSEVPWSTVHLNPKQTSGLARRNWSC
jgi:hypothetical protein